MSESLDPFCPVGRALDIIGERWTILIIRDMFVLGPDQPKVSSCNGSGRGPYMEYPLLATAIKLVDMPLSDARGTQRLLSKEFYSRFERALMDEFFDLVEKIDPTGVKTTRSADRIEYRGIVVFFSDGKYESVQTL